MIRWLIWPGAKCGEPPVIEAELIEPYLYPRQGPGFGAMLAEEGWMSLGDQFLWIFTLETMPGF